MGMNTLLTSAGRRSELVGYFQAALRGREGGRSKGRGRVFAADSRSGAPALQEADDAVIVPPVGDVHYIDALLEFAQQAQIDLLVPLSVAELPYLAAAKAQFADLGTKVVVSSPEVTLRCADKWQTHNFLRAHGLSTPKTYGSLAAALGALAASEITFPLVLKPRWGAGSVGLEFPADEAELRLGYDLLVRRLERTTLAAPAFAELSDARSPVEVAQTAAQTVLIQEFIVGDEHGLDVVSDLTGRYVTTFTSQKLALWGGETVGAVTAQNEPLEALGRTLAYTFGHVGDMACDVLVGADGPNVIDLNLCLGSTYPFAHVAGANLPAALFAWAKGETPDPAWLRAAAGIKAVRSSQLLLERT